MQVMNFKNEIIKWRAKCIPLYITLSIDVMFPVLQCEELLSAEVLQCSSCI